MAVNKLGTFQDPLLDRQITEIVRALNKIVITEPGQGVIMRTPDGTKYYEVKITNAGAVTTALVTV